MLPLVVNRPKPNLNPRRRYYIIGPNCKNLVYALHTTLCLFSSPALAPASPLPIPSSFKVVLCIYHKLIDLKLSTFCCLLFVQHLYTCVYMYVCICIRYIKK